MMGIKTFFLTFFVSLFLTFSFVTNAATYYSRQSGNWGAGGSWSNSSCGGTSCLCIPSLTSDVINLCGAYTITVASTYASGGTINLSAGTLIIPNGITLTVVNLNMTGGTLTVNGTLNVTGSFTKTAGTFTAPTVATGTVGFTGGAQTIPNIPYYDLNIAGSGNKTLSAGITIIYNKLYLTSNNLIVGSNTLQLGGAGYGAGLNSTTPTGKITTTSASNLIFGGGTYDYNLVNILSNTWPVTLASFKMLRNLATITLGAGKTLTVTGAFDLTAGSASGSGNFVIGAGSTLELSGDVTGAINGSIKGGSTSNLTINGSGVMSMYFNLGNTLEAGTNTIRNFYIDRSGTFYLLSSIRIGNTLTLNKSTTYFKLSKSGSQTITFDGTNTAWEGLGYFQGNSSYLNSFYIYGSGTIPNPLKFITATSSDYTLSSLQLHRLGATLQLESNLIITSSLILSNLSGYGSLDVNGKTIDIGASGRVYNESDANQIYNSACPAIGLITSTNTLVAGTSYTGASQNSTYGRNGSGSYAANPSGYRGLGIDIVTGVTAPGSTIINAGFCNRSGLELEKSILKYVDITPTTNSGLGLTLKMYYYTAELNALLDNSTLGFYRDPTIGSNQWVSRQGDWVSQNVTLNGIDEFSSWTLGQIAVPMPVELVFFDVNCRSGKAILSWETASETNCESYAIQRSTDSKNWEMIGNVKGAGNSNQPVYYSFTDDSPIGETSYYRLIQLDYDGKSEIYGPVSATCLANENDEGVSIFPNPTSGSVWIQTSIAAPGKMVLCDITGRIITEYFSSDLSRLLDVSLQGLIPGIYLIRIESEGYSKYFKVARQ